MLKLYHCLISDLRECPIHVLGQLISFLGVGFLCFLCWFLSCSYLTLILTSLILPLSLVFSMYFYQSCIWSPGVRNLFCSWGVSSWFLVLGGNHISSDFRMPVLNMQMLSFPLFGSFKFDSVGLTLFLLQLFCGLK